MSMWQPDKRIDLEADYCLIFQKTSVCMKYIQKCDPHPIRPLSPEKRTYLEKECPQANTLAPGLREISLDSNQAFKIKVARLRHRAKSNIFKPEETVSLV